MQRPDHSSIVAFVAFAAAATMWIGVMAAQPKPEGLLASTIIMTKDIALAQQPALILADLSR
ncbi:hypothetical protein RPMA_13760 [Tardiphaga alba]|uniref:Uncharacterized protein n=1 Tax=Tardiphaga alba TaxID=340268 RepID=A0ABX8A8Z3_9BRAD|nr:hypothetical protein [Tardiphaga alba]QUS39786.1 hypothetical protein RPMA_13760 [Tardiphaga alba]